MATWLRARASGTCLDLRPCTELSKTSESAEWCNAAITHQTVLVFTWDTYYFKTCSYKPAVWRVPFIFNCILTNKHLQARSFCNFKTIGGKCTIKTWHQSGFLLCSVPWLQFGVSLRLFTFCFQCTWDMHNGTVRFTSQEINIIEAAWDYLVREWNKKWPTFTEECFSFILMTWTNYVWNKIRSMIFLDKKTA